MASHITTFSGAHNQGPQVGINSGTVNNYFSSRAGTSAPQSVVDDALTSFHLDRPSTPPKPSSNVPFRRDKDYVDRGDIITRIDERCSQPAGRAVLVGFGGFGYDSTSAGSDRR